MAKKNTAWSPSGNSSPGFRGANMTYKSALNKYVNAMVKDLNKVKKNVDARWDSDKSYKEWFKAEKDMYKKCDNLIKKIKKIDDGAGNVNNLVKQLQEIVTRNGWDLQGKIWLQSKVNDFGAHTASYGNTRKTQVKIGKTIFMVNKKDVEKCLTLTDQIGVQRKKNLNAYKNAKNYFNGAYQTSCKKWKSVNIRPFISYANDYKKANADIKSKLNYTYKTIYVAGVSAKLIHQYMLKMQEKLKDFNKVTKKQYNKAKKTANKKYNAFKTKLEQLKKAKTKSEAQKIYEELKKLKKSFSKQYKNYISKYKNAKQSTVKAYKKKLNELKSLLTQAASIVAAKGVEVTKPVIGGDNGNSDNSDNKKKNTKKKKSVISFS